MFKNYLKIALRNLVRYKGYSLINITGLAIGIASSLLILMWIQDELSYDRFHQNASQIYRVYRDESATAANATSALTSPPMAPALKKDFPEIIRATRFGTWGQRLVKYGEKTFTEDAYYHVDRDFFEIFSYPLIEGDPANVFQNPNSIVITEEKAKKYFGDEDPIGKHLTINNQFDVEVTGVMKNIAENSSLKFNLLSPFDLLLSEFIGEDNRENWGFNSMSSFVMLTPMAPIQELNRKLHGYLQKYQPDDTDLIQLQAFTDIHLYSNLEHDRLGKGYIKYIRIFASLALLILIIACINFMNLATSRSAKRAKEVGLRKTVGATHFQLIFQFYGESLLLTLFALITGLLFVEIFLPEFNQLAGKNLTMNYSLNSSIFLGMIGITIFTALLAGSYPAFYLSAFQPAKVLKSQAGSSNRGYLFRKLLVIVQFVFSIFLIIGALVISKQLNFMRNKDPGIAKERIVYLRLAGELRERYQNIKTELLKLPDVINITASLSLPTDIGNSPGSPEWEGKDPNNKMEIKADFVDYDYIETFNIEMVAGRSFSRAFSTDDSAAYVVNQEAVRLMGLDSPVGKSFSFWGIEGQIIGIMKDFHFQPFHKKIDPLVFKIYPNWFRRIYIKIKSDNIGTAIQNLKERWTGLNPDYPFEYSFLNEDFENLYRAEKRLSTLFKNFTFLAIFISCLGLFGLAAFAAEQRTKEIGIRKVLGANVTGIVKMLSKEFIKWVLAANIIAWPVAYVAMNSWLQNFAYRIDVGIWIFFLAGALALVIALLTVSYQAVRAAVANPVEALRYE
jgi:ABC-type antimicrobial peptide transport system permease subunit